MRIFISSIALLFISSSFGFGEDPEELSVAPRVVRELKVVSVVRGMPVYEYEVREAVQQHAHELQGLSGKSELPRNGRSTNESCGASSSANSLLRNSSRVCDLWIGTRRLTN